MAQIIQVCNKLLVLFIILFNFEIVKSEVKKSSYYGSFLSWNHAKQNSDSYNLKKFLYEIDLDQIDKNFYEEILFQSVIFGDWNNSRLISEKILLTDENNILANFYMTVEKFLKSESSENYLDNIKLKEFDSNFIRAINIWLGYKDTDELNIESECIPIICLHTALFYKNKKNKEKSDKYFKKIEIENFASFRLKEILLLNAIDKKNHNEVLKKNEELKKLKINFQNYDIDYLKNHKYLFNPIYTQSDGIAEVLYNISSWYYSNDLNMYAAFFGKLSLRLRSDFNAMSLLLAGILNDLEFDNIALKNLHNIDEKNIYFYKIFKMRLAFLEKLEKNKIFINELKEFTNKFPREFEMKRILGDKYRKLKNYEQAIDVYSQLIENDKLEGTSNILYSRGISYEQIKNWEKAEQDFKRSLDLNPNDPYVMNYLAYSWLDRKMNINKALELLKKAVDLEPSDGYIRDSLGWAYFLSKKFEESVYHLEKAVVMLPNDATLNDHLGDAYWMSNRKSEALSQWKKVLVIDPDYKDKNLVQKKINKGL